MKTKEHDTRSLFRRRDWRPRLVEWAQQVRGLPYVWGRTDCGSLVREAMIIQFGEDIVPTLPHWTSAFQANRLWATTLQEGGGVESLMEQLGAVEVTGQQYGWPMGTIIITSEDSGLPALGVYIGPIIVQSDQEHGVVWCDPTELKLESAWILEHARVHSNG